MESNSKNILTVPVAIVIAGALIAGTLFIVRGGDAGTSAGAEAGHPQGPQGIGALFGTAPAGGTNRPAPTASLSAIPALNPNTDHVLGNPNANIVILEYSDLECPFCRIFHQTLQRIMDDYGKSGSVAWAYRHFPLAQLHSKAPHEAEASECAADLGGNAGFWKFIDRVFAVTPSNDGLDPAQLPDIAAYAGLDVTAFNTCLASGKHTAAIQTSYNDAVNAGGRGTPYNVLMLQKPVTAAAQQTLAPLFDAYRDPQTGEPPIAYSADGYRMSISGAMPYEVMKKTLDTLLK